MSVLAGVRDQRTVGRCKQATQRMNKRERLKAKAKTE